MTSIAEQETKNQETVLKERHSKILEALRSNGNFIVLNDCDDLSQVAFKLKEESPDDFCIIDLRNPNTSPEDLLQETLAETRITQGERRALFWKQITLNTDDIEQRSPHIVVLGLNTLLSRVENLQFIDGIPEFDQIIDVTLHAQRFSKGGTTMGLEGSRAVDTFDIFSATGRPKRFRRLWLSTEGFETIE